MFGRATITLGIGPHSSFNIEQRLYSAITSGALSGLNVAGSKKWTPFPDLLLRSHLRGVAGSKSGMYKMWSQVGEWVSTGVSFPLRGAQYGR